MDDTVSREQLVEEMRAGGREFVEAARAVTPDKWAEGRYEEGWTAKDILAHVASIEWTYPKLLLLAQQPPENRDSEKAFKAGIGDYNQRHVEKRRENTVEELLDEFERNRTNTIAAVEQADGELFSRQVRSAGGIEGSAAEVLRYVAVTHVVGHLDDLRGTS
ncbi:MAG: DinB family protein [Actinomycetota bacterium]